MAAPLRNELWISHSRQRSKLRGMKPRGLNAEHLACVEKNSTIGCDFENARRTIVRQLTEIQADLRSNLVILSVIVGRVSVRIRYRLEQNGLSLRSADTLRMKDHARHKDRRCL